MSPIEITTAEHAEEARESLDFLNMALRKRDWKSVKFWAEDVIKAMKAVKETVSG